MIERERERERADRHQGKSIQICINVTIGSVLKNRTLHSVACHTVHCDIIFVIL